MTLPEQQNARLAAIYEVSARLGTTLDLDELLNLVMDSIIDLTQAERGFVMLISETSGALELVAARNIDKETITRPSEISRTVVDRAVATDSAILTINAQEDDRFSAYQSVVSYKLRSIMCAPLRARGRVIGAAYVDNRYASGVFAEADRDLLAAFANQAAIAIENARLFRNTDQELARRLEEVSLFQQIDRQLNQSLDLNRVLNLALDWAAKLTDAERGSIGLLDHDQAGLEVIHLQANTHDQPRNLAITDPAINRVLVSQKSVHIPSADVEGQTVTQLIVPIGFESQIIGMVFLESSLPNAFPPKDVAFVERLADRAAVAIENSRLYEKVDAARQEQINFLSVVTHELRAPMTSIGGYTDLVMSGVAGDLSKQQKEFLEIVQRNVDRMDLLVQDLSALNSLESDRVKFVMGFFQAEDVIKETQTELADQLREAGHDLTLDIPSDLPPVYGDRERTAQIVTNLLSNAVKYTPNNGQVKIVVRSLSTAIEIAVIDNGIGISTADQEQLADKFFRSEDEYVRDQPGWGLGLAIVIMLVEAQRGQFSLESTLGQGSTFAFTIPTIGEPILPA